MGAVTNFRGKSHVGVIEDNGLYRVMLARIGAKTATQLASYVTAEAAVGAADYLARDHGWKFTGLFDEHRLREIEKWSGDGLARRQAEADGTGPEAA